jgi:hypothetical protein
MMKSPKSNAMSAIRKKKILLIGVLEFLEEVAVVVVTATGIIPRAIIITILPFPLLVYQVLHSQPTPTFITSQGMNILKKKTQYIQMR